MADSTLAGLAAAAALDGTELVYLDQGGDVKATVDAIVAFAEASLGLAAVATSGSASDLGTGTLPIARIADGAVTYAKVQNVSATDKLLGRSTAGAGVVEEIACTAAGRALLDDANAAAQRTTLGLVIGTDVKAQVPSVQSVASSATVTPTFSDDGVKITAQAAGLTLANPSGTPVDMWGWAIRIKDNGTARGISYDTQYRAVGVNLPTTTIINKTLYLGCIWNNEDSKVDVVSIAQEA